ncbi:archemetzincin [Thermococcus sp. 18S1]|uniref:archaemetzincin family Zn-dependent metalloprotease n=1 Tax=Thermococcus sp. 18S1 TaxID=1638210 RepID=UPI00143AB822|nr:archemetzincin [Thermococcus sp. 18S1]
MILVVPIGDVDTRTVEAVSRFVGSYYSRLGLPARVSDPIPAEWFSDAYNPSRNQFIGRVFLETLGGIKAKTGARAVLGITSLDLYEKGLNFIFGLAHPGMGAAIISTFRLRPEFYGEETTGNLLIERAVKEAMHELGHIFGLGHCPNRWCVMHFSNSILDTDVKGPYYCTSCELKLKKNWG